MDLKTPAVYMICGLQGGGKSHLIRYMMRECRDRFDFGIVFSNTGFVEGNFDYISRPFVHLQYSSGVLHNFKKLLEGQIEAGKPRRAFVIFDDCITGPQWKCPELVSLVTQVRHYGVTIFISTQYPKAITPLVRTNTWLAIMFAFSTEDSLKALWSNYGQHYGSYQEFKQYFLAATGKRHQFVVYNAREGGDDSRDRYRVMICPKTIPEFTVGPTPK